MPCRNHPEVVEDLVRCFRCGEAFCRDCIVDLRELPHCKSCKDEVILDLRSGVDDWPAPVSVFYLIGRLLARVLRFFHG